MDLPGILNGLRDDLENVNITILALERIASSVTHRERGREGGRRSRIKLTPGKRTALGKKAARARWKAAKKKPPMTAQALKEE